MVSITTPIVGGPRWEVSACAPYVMYRRHAKYSNASGNVEKLHMAKDHELNAIVFRERIALL